MKIEKFIPKKDTAEILGITLSDIFDELKKLTPEELRETPREYVIKGKIDAQLLKEIRNHGVEFSISGESNRLVFGTGSKGTIEPFIHLLFQDRDDTYPSPVKRYLEASYNMHSHDSKTGIVPSLDDVNSLINSKASSSVIFTERGVLKYTWNKEMDVYQKFSRFLELKYSKENITYPKEFFELSNERQVEILADFYKAFDVIVSDIPWEEPEKCQALVDQHFDQ